MSGPFDANLKYGNAAILANWSFQSNVSPQYAQMSCRNAESVPYSQPESGMTSGQRVRLSRSRRSSTAAAEYSGSNRSMVMSAGFLLGCYSGNYYQVSARNALT